LSTSEFAAAFRVTSDLDALDQSLAKLMADDGRLTGFHGGEGMFIPSDQAGLSLQDLSFPPFDAAQWLSDDMPTPCLDSLTDMASTYMGSQSLYSQNSLSYADNGITSIFPPTGAQSMSGPNVSPVASTLSSDMPTYAELQHYRMSDSLSSRVCRC
jgi:hypothetical protein